MTALSIGLFVLLLLLATVVGLKQMGGFVNSRKPGHVNIKIVSCKYT